MYFAANLSTMPWKVRLNVLAPRFVATLYGGLCRRRSISALVYLDSFVSLSNRPDRVIRDQPQQSTAYSGNRMAPSFNDFEASRNFSISTPSLRPRPLHSGHMPV